MPKLSPLELKAMLAAERMDALSAMRASKLSAERTDAMDYYLGDMAKDMPAQDGRSRAVSTDVADTIEGLMPSLMEIFAGSDEVVRFEPVGPEDVAAAEQETDYVNHVFMQRNPGFLILYSFIKDALLSKVGVVKVWWETKEEQQRETYLDQPDDAFALLAADPEIEIVAHSARPDPAFAHLLLPDEARSAEDPASLVPAEEPGAPVPADEPGLQALAPGTVPAFAGGADAPAGAGAPPIPMLHDVTVLTVRRSECARVEGVPPEEFGISRNARSLRDCGYCFHEVIRREEDLIADGFDPEQIRALPSYTGLTNPEELARDTVDEHLSTAGDEGVNHTNRMILVTEHYVRMDYAGDGRPALYRVTTGSEQGDILKRDGEFDVTPQDAIPFAAMTPVIVTHRFFGRSIADLVMDIQRVKTALLRSILDNAYLAVNPRVEVSETHATETTLDDLLVSRPGGIVRTRQPGGLNWQTVPAIAGEIFPVLQYADATREWRTGVSRQSQGLDANALQSQTATAAVQVYNAAQARMKLIARIFAETGIRDLFSLLHATIRKHGGKPATVRLRNAWVTVDPRDFQERNDMTINVGLGTGGKSERLAQLMALINLQKEALAAGKSNLVSDRNLFNAARQFARISEFKNYADFFTDPASAPAPQPAPDPKLLQIQAQAALDRQQAQSQAAVHAQKAQSDITLAQQRFALDRQMALLQHDLAAREQQFRHLQSAASASLAAEGDERPPGDGSSPGAPAALIAHLMQLLQQLNAPKRVVRDAQGRVAGVEPAWPAKPVPPAETMSGAPSAPTTGPMPTPGMTNGLVQ